MNGGNQSKLDKIAVLNIICTYDIVFPTEYWFYTAFSITIPGYHCFCMLDESLRRRYCNFKKRVFFLFHIK